jgi:hypothetical protein
MRYAFSLVALACLSVCLLPHADGETTESVADADQLRFFENTIRPLLVTRCYECHSGDKSEGGLRLDVADAISKGGDSGPPAVAGKPAESLLVSAIRYEELEMPPDQPLAASEQAAIEKWIAAGAIWPITEQAAAEADDGPWWAAEPLDAGDPVDAGVESPTRIDAYIDSKLAEVELRRAPPTDRSRLIRRLYYDLLGLPPTPAQIERFANDQRPGAYERLVDRLFADPAYGERMGRLWLDLVRYAESDGWRQDAYRPQAYQYRDWVINAFNRGMPYDQFVTCQIAGDELAPGDDDAQAAAGFLRLGIYEYNQRDAEGQWQNIVDEITDVTADVFLATGMACAKCHDHKFDPISRADYYHLRSVFEPLVFVDRQPPAKTIAPENRAEVDRLREELDQIEGKAKRSLQDAVVDKFPLNVQAMYRKPADQRTSYEEQMAYIIDRQRTDEGTAGGKVDKKIGKEAAERRKQIVAKLRSLGDDPEPTPDLLTVADAPGPIRPTRLPGRSNGVAFDPAAPSVYGGASLDPPTRDPSTRSTRRRTALARWITSPENPVSARVLANRLWQYHFGTGLVDSPNDFGRLGAPPSHPRLLDYLAQQLIDSGWNIQVVQREILLSATYRQSAIHPQATEARQVDAANRLLWHHKVRRLDAEQFRDSLLVAMGTLRNEYGGPSLAGKPPRRSLYLQRKRNTGDEMLLLLDAPPGIVSTAKRDVTTTAPQSLMLLNNTRMTGVAGSFAERVRRDLGDNYQPIDFVNHAHLIITGLIPPPETAELLASAIGKDGIGEADVCHVLLNDNAFLFVE